MFLRPATNWLYAAALFLAFSQRTQAQPAISDIKVEAISHATVAVRFQVSGMAGPTENWLEYGPTHLLGFRTTSPATSTTSPFRSLVIGGLKPDSSYYFRVVVTGGEQVATWYCRSGEGGPGYVCDGPDAPPRFQTAPSPGEGPVPPAIPEAAEHAFPEINGETFMVSVDEQQRCVDLQQRLDAAAAADPEKNHQVVIPAGATCYGEYVLPRKLGSGIVILKPSTPIDRLPPSGVRIDPSFKPLMATLSVAPAWRSAGQFVRPVLTLPPASACAAPCTEGWRLVGLEITHPDHSSIAPRQARITSISPLRPGLTRITLDQSFPTEQGQSVAIAGVSGAPLLNRVWMVSPIAPDAFAVQTDIPSEGASGGYVSQALSVRVESCGPGPRPVCRTSLPHGLSEPMVAPITSISNGNVRTPGIFWPLMSTVEITGAPGLDGLWGATWLNAGVRLAGAPASSCTADCGTVRLRPSVQVFGFDGEQRLQGSRIYTVVSETEVRLDDIEEATSETGGGYLAFDPNPFWRLVTFGANGRNIVLDRCWIHGRGFPTRLQGAVSFSADDSALVDSVVADVNSWRPLTRQGGSADSGAHGYFAGVATPLVLGDVSRVVIRNNLFENCVGITIFAESLRATSYLSPRDIVITGNTFHNDDRLRAGSATSDGRYYGIRHTIEFKRGERLLIEGNVFEGNWADWTPVGPAIGLLTRGAGPEPNNRIQDVTIRDNIFRRVSTAIHMLSTDDQIDQPSLPTARVAIENNLFEGVDFYQMRSTPSGIGLIGPSTNYGGQVVFASGAFEDLSITRNTAIDNRGRGPAFFWYQHGRSSGVAVTDNVLTHNDDFGFGGLPRARHVSEFESVVKGSARDAFAHVFTQTPDPDPRSTFARNLILPGVRDSSSPAAYDDTEARGNFSKADCEDFYAGFPEIECAGSGEPGETANQRIAVAFPNRREPRESNGRGADLARLSALGRRISLAPVALLAGAATLEFQTGSPASCLVDISATPDFADFQRFADSGGEQHSVSLEGLETGRAYHYRIKCPSDTLFGVIEIP